MEYGLIGEHLMHSFSKEIHSRLGSYPYELCELSPEAFEAFMEKKDFVAINVTIPYKQAVMPHLDEISIEAKLIGAVNTVVNCEGKLCGYNTDFYGILAALGKMGVRSLCGKKVLILGTGGTSRTAHAVARYLGADSIFFVSRTGKKGAVTYEEAREKHADAHFIFNTTPVGMYPNTASSPISLDVFTALEGVFDAIYNPLRTRLVSEARARGIVAECGLYMLVAQAFFASEIFFEKKYDPTLLSIVYEEIRKTKENIVLIGMPASGKTTLGTRLAAHLDKPFFDADNELVKSEKRSISEIFSSDGEDVFRALESETLAALSLKTGCVIATGGGAVLNEENVRRLKQNGILVFLDRSPEKLIPTLDRPTAQTREAIEKRYRERYALYLAAADVRIDGNGTENEVFDAIRKELTL